MTDKSKGKGKPYLSVVRDTDRLTAKQEAFAQQVAGGAILSDAYRECYAAQDGLDRGLSPRIEPQGRHKD